MDERANPVSPFRPAALERLARRDSEPLVPPLLSVGRRRVAWIALAVLACGAALSLRARVPVASAGLLCVRPAGDGSRDSACTAVLPAAAASRVTVGQRVRWRFSGQEQAFAGTVAGAPEVVRLSEASARLEIAADELARFGGPALCVVEIDVVEARDTPHRLAHPAAPVGGPHEIVVELDSTTLLDLLFSLPVETLSVVPAEGADGHRAR